MAATNGGRLLVMHIIAMPARASERKRESECVISTNCCVASAASVADITRARVARVQPITIKYGLTHTHAHAATHTC